MKIGFIGCGNMGGAMMKGIIDSGKCKASDIYTSDASEAALAIRKEELGVNTSSIQC